MTARNIGTEQNFEARIKDNPADAEGVLIYADWLEEQGDDRCRFLRGNRFCADCIPVLGLWRSALIWHGDCWTCPRLAPVRLEYRVTRPFEFAHPDGREMWTLELDLNDMQLVPPLGSRLEVQATFHGATLHNMIQPYDLATIPPPLTHSDFEFPRSQFRDDTLTASSPEFRAALNSASRRIAEDVERQILFPPGTTARGLRWYEYPGGYIVYAPAAEVRAADNKPIVAGSRLLDASTGQHVGYAMSAPNGDGRIQVRLGWDLERPIW